MSGRIRPPAKRPCGSCPYRRDVPSGVWAQEEYEKLPRFDGTTGEQMEQGGWGVFLCHQQDGRACAGWVGCHDMSQALGLRMALGQGLLADEDVDAFLDYTTDVPLFASGTEAAEHGLAELLTPSEKARRTVSRLERKLGT